jgi:hypothetical protein
MAAMAVGDVWQSAAGAHPGGARLNACDPAALGLGSVDECAGPRCSPVVPAISRHASHQAHDSLVGPALSLVKLAGRAAALSPHMSDANLRSARAMPTRRRRRAEDRMLTDF